MWGKRREAQSETSPHADVQKFFSPATPAPAEQVSAPATAETVQEASDAPVTPAAGSPANGAAARPATTAESVLPLLERAARPVRANPVSTAFGDMVALLAKSPAHKHLSLADLEWLLLPPVALGQFALADSNLPNGQTVLSGFVLWARVAPDVDARLAASPRYPIRLQPSEWRSGDVHWIIDAVGNPNMVRNIITELAKAAFEGKQFKMIASADRGQPASAQRHVALLGTEA